MIILDMWEVIWKWLGTGMYNNPIANLITLFILSGSFIVLIYIMKKSTWGYENSS